MRLATNVYNVPLVQKVPLSVALQLEATFDDIHHLHTGINMGSKAVLLARQKFSHTWTHTSLRYEDPEAFGDVIHIRRTHLQAYPVSAALNAENAVLGGLKEEGDILLKYER